MPRYAAFLRGVSPMNCKMPELKRCLEKAGFTDVQTVISSGNAVFTAASGNTGSLEKKIETATEEFFGKEFRTVVKSIEDLEVLLESDPYTDFKLKPGSKRVVTFLKEPPKSKPKLPAELDGASILKPEKSTVFTSYVPQPGNPIFMHFLEKTFGKDITTRTWETLQKVVKKSST